MSKFKISLPAIIGLLIPIYPFLSAFIASAIASMLDIRLHEGSPPDIPILGTILYSMLVEGWFMIITIPLGIITIPAGIITSIVLYSKQNQTKQNLNKKA
ncbi:hypothetical protein EP331_04550 [bacterium]|nr:MAG: hypothetical protein EP331_04550 [bacterium]